jgi:hypothetical protein
MTARVDDFLDKVRNDSAVWDRLAAAADRSAPMAFAAMVQDAARSLGVELSAEEAGEAVLAISRSSPQALSDEQLESVAGGTLSSSDAMTRSIRSSTLDRSILDRSILGG